MSFKLISNFKSFLNRDDDEPQIVLTDQPITLKYLLNEHRLLTPTPRKFANFCLKYLIRNATSYLGVEFPNFQILHNLYFDFFSKYKAKTANWAETAA